MYDQIGKVVDHAAGAPVGLVLGAAQGMIGQGVKAAAEGSKSGGLVGGVVSGVVGAAFGLVSGAITGTFRGAIRGATSEFDSIRFDTASQLRDKEAAQRKKHERK